MEGGSKGFFWSEILAKRDFFGLWKTWGFFWVAKKHRDVLGYCTFHQLKSTITYNYLKYSLLLVWDFLGYAKNVGIFWG